MTDKINDKQKEALAILKKGGAPDGRVMRGLRNRNLVSPTGKITKAGETALAGG